MIGCNVPTSVTSTTDVAFSAVIGEQLCELVSCYVEDVGRTGVGAVVVVVGRADDHPGRTDCDRQAEFVAISGVIGEQLRELETRDVEDALLFDSQSEVDEYVETNRSALEA